MASIIRIAQRQSKPFVMIDKSSLWDSRLSLDAVGLWARLLSRPDNWQVRVSELTKSCGCSEGKIQRLLRELIKYRYVGRIKHVTSEGKKKLSTFYEYVVFEEPISEEEFNKCFRHPAFRGVEDRAVENGGTNNKESKEKEREEERNPPIGSQGEPLSKNEVPPKHEKLKRKGNYAEVSMEEIATAAEQIGKDLAEEAFLSLDDYIPNKPTKPYKDHDAAYRTFVRRLRMQKQGGGSYGTTPNHSNRTTRLPRAGMDNSQYKGLF